MLRGGSLALLALTALARSSARLACALSNGSCWQPVLPAAKNMLAAKAWLAASAATFENGGSASRVSG